MASAHLRGTHALPQLKIPDQMLKDICAKYNIPPKLPTITGPVPLIRGLSLVEEGWKCPLCSGIGTTQKSVTKHYTDKHPGLKLPSHWDKVPVQRLSKMPGHGKSYFEVVLPGDQDEDPDLDLRGLRKECDELYDDFKQTEFDPRSVSPWLLSTRWHEHVAKYDWQLLRALVQLPGNTDGDLQYIKATVNVLLDQAMNLIANTPVLALQKLVSSDPVKE